MLGVLSCLYLMLGLPWITWVRFGLWLVVGMVVYFLYGFRRSRLVQGDKPRIERINGFNPLNPFNPWLIQFWYRIFGRV